MKKATSRRKRDAPPSGKAKTAEELQTVGNKVANVVTDGAVGMVEGIVQSVQEGGSGANATTLSSTCGRYRAVALPKRAAKREEQELLAKVLMARLGFSEDTMPKAKAARLT